MNEEERQRLRQLEQATVELANTLDFQQQAIEAVRNEIQADIDRRFRRIGDLFDNLVGDIRADRQALRTLEQRVDDAERN